MTDDDLIKPDAPESYKKKVLRRERDAAKQRKAEAEAILDLSFDEYLELLRMQGIKRESQTHAMALEMWRQHHRATFLAFRRSWT